MKVIGIDVGGTNTDATLLSETRQVLGMVKVATDQDNVFRSTKTALQEILAFLKEPSSVKLQLSTTLSTNAIVENTGQVTAVLAIPGPGINLEDYGFEFPLYPLQGYVDHRGRIVSALDQNEVIRVAKQAVASGAQALAIVGKFSHRNSSLEKQAAALIRREQIPIKQITLGHELSGRLNFPRRIVTAYFNARVAEQQIAFAEMINTLRKEYPQISQVQILKADGGTMSLQESCKRPVETILSGPAASIMAANALSRYQDTNLVVVDIGGTTTDLAVIVGGEALLHRNGVEIDGWKTQVPGLLSYSLGLGGDSQIHLKANQIQIGPRRAGRPVVLGGIAVTPTDAAVALGLADLGDRQQAIQALTELATTRSESWQELAEEIIKVFIHQLTAGINHVYQRLENVPVYTVSEILAPPDIQPQVLVGLGAPAQVFTPLAAKQLDLAWEVLPYHAGANGIGSAAAQPTVGITLYADTEQELLVIPELGYEEQIQRSLFFDIKQAREVVVEQLARYAEELGLVNCNEIRIVEQEAFNMVRGFRTVGKIFHIRAQIRPQVYQVAGEYQC